MPSQPGSLHRWLCGSEGSDVVKIAVMGAGGIGGYVGGRLAALAAYFDGPAKTQPSRKTGCAA